jgi:hypothetical protein
VKKSKSPEGHRSASRSKSPEKDANPQPDSPVADGTPPKMDRSPGKRSPEDDREDGDNAADKEGEED